MHALMGYEATRIRKLPRRYKLAPKAIINVSIDKNVDADSQNSNFYGISAKIILLLKIFVGSGSN